MERTRRDIPLHVKILAQSRFLSSELSLHTDSFISTFPDYYILNIGCVDAPSRYIPRWYSDVLFKRKWISLHRIFNLVDKKILRLPIFKAIGFFLLGMTGSNSWVSKNRFTSNINNFIKLLLKETNATILVIGINSGNETIEKKLPGTLEKYYDYNNALKKICHQDKVHFIDVGNMNSEEHFPDGVHYNQFGHNALSNRIYEIIAKLENKKK